MKFFQSNDDTYKFIPETFQVSGKGKIQNGTLVTLNKYWSVEKKRIFNSKSFTEEDYDDFLKKFSLEINDRNVLLNRDLRIYNGIEVEEKELTKTSRTSRGLRQFLENETNVYNPLNYLKKNLEINDILDVFYTEMAKLESSDHTPMFPDPDNLPDVIDDPSVLDMLGINMAKSLSRIIAIENRRKRSWIYTLRVGRYLVFHRLNFNDFLNTMKSIRCISIPGSRGKTKDIFLKDIIENNLQYFTVFMDRIYHPFGGTRSRYSLNPATSGVLNTYIPSPVPVDFKTFFFYAVRYMIKNLDLDYPDVDPNSFQEILDLCVKHVQEKFSDDDHMLIPSSYEIGQFILQMLAIRMITEKIICNGDESKIKILMMKLLLGLVNPQPTPALLKFMILVIGEKGLGKTGVIKFWEWIYQENAGKVGGINAFLNKLNGFSQGTEAILLLLDEFDMPYGEKYDDFKRFITTDTHPVEQKYENPYKAKNSHQIVGTMNRKNVIGTKKGTTDKEPPSRRVKTFIIQPPSNYTNEERVLFYKTAFEIPEHLSIPEQAVLQSLAIDFFYALYPHTEKDYHKPIYCPQADYDTLKLFQEQTIVSKPLLWLSEVAEKGINVGPGIRSDDTSVEYAILPSMFYNLKTKTDEMTDVVSKLKLVNIEKHNDTSLENYQELNSNNTLIVSVGSVIRQNLDLDPDDLFDDIPLVMRTNADDSWNESVFLCCICLEGVKSNCVISNAFKTFYSSYIEANKDENLFMIPGSTDGETAQSFMNSLNEISPMTYEGVPISDFNIKSTWKNFTSRERTRVITYEFPPFSWILFKLMKSPEYHKTELLLNLYPNMNTRIVGYHSGSNPSRYNVFDKSPDVVESSFGYFEFCVWFYIYITFTKNIKTDFGEMMKSVSFDGKEYEIVPLPSNYEKHLAMFLEIIIPHIFKNVLHLKNKPPSVLAKYVLDQWSKRSNVRMLMENIISTKKFPGYRGLFIETPLKVFFASEPYERVVYLEKPTISKLLKPLLDGYYDAENNYFQMKNKHQDEEDVYDLPDDDDEEYESIEDLNDRYDYFIRSSKKRMREEEYSDEDSREIIRGNFN